MMPSFKIICVCGLFLIFPRGDLRAELLLDTAEGTISGGYSSLNVRDGIWPGHRFEVTSAGFNVTSVGGFFEGDTTSITAFAALVSLSGPADYPDSFDLTTPDLVATTTFDVPQDHFDNLSIPFSASLTSGWYALVYGTGAFGADSVGSDAFDGFLLPGLPTDLEPTQQAFSLFNSANTSPTDTVIDQTVTSDFVVEGNALNSVPEPSSMLLLGLCGLGTSVVAVRRRRTQLTA